MQMMKHTRIFLIVIFLLGWACHLNALHAEPLEFIYEHYSSDDGLPHNSICEIHQDR